MNLSILTLTISQLLSQSLSDHPLDDGYWDRWPAFTAGGSHCDPQLVNGKLTGWYEYKFSPALLRSMGQQYPRIKMLGPDGITHRMEFKAADGQYHYVATDQFAGKVAHWMERQNYYSKITERELVLPGTKPSAKWKVSTGNSTTLSTSKP
jgi:hypothetical protein